MPPKISVIIPCFNLGRYLDEAVDSVLRQSYQDFEVIIVDDGSTDEYTRKLLDDFRRPKTRVIRQDNRGVSAARNRGIGSSGSQYICCLDADDMYHPTFLEKAVNVLESDDKKEIGFVTSWYETFGEEKDLWKTGRYNPGRLAIENIVHVGSLFRREGWEKAGGYDEDIPGHEDWDFWLSLAALGYRWHCLEEPLFYYRVRDGSKLTESRIKKEEIFKLMVRKNEEFYRRNVRGIMLESSRKFGKLNRIWHNNRELWQKNEGLGRRLIDSEKREEDYHRRLMKTGVRLTKAQNVLARTKWGLQVAEKRLFQLEGDMRALHMERQNMLESRSWVLASLLGRVGEALFPTDSLRRKLAEGAYRPFQGLVARTLTVIFGEGRVKVINNRKLKKGAPLLSVVIPCFNYGEYIEEAIDSVLRQTFRNLEIIVVDGGSDDGKTVEILESIKKPKTTVYFRKGCHLVGDNRNYGIARASGRYICCLDADDKLRPTYLEKALFYLEKYNCDVVYPSVQCFGGDNLLWQVEPATFLGSLEVGNAVSTVALFRKKVWEKAGGYKDWPIGEGHVPEDWEFWTRLLGHGFRFKRLKEPLMLYRVHGSGLTARAGMNVEKQREVIKKEVRELLDPENLERLESLGKIGYTVRRPYVNLMEKREEGKTNLLIILPYVITGGADSVILSLVRFLSGRNYDIYLITTLPTNSRFGDNKKEYEKVTRGRYHLFDFLENEPEYLDFIEYLIEAKNIDIVLQVGSEFFYHMLPTIRSNHPHLAIVDQLFNEFGHLGNNRRYASMIDLNIVASNKLRDILLEDFEERPEKVHMITHGVDVKKRYNPESYEFPQDGLKAMLPEGKFIVSFIGRFSEEKGPGVFIDIAHSLQDKEDVYFVMIGQGPLYEEMLDKIEDYELKERIITPGLIDDVRELLSLSDILVMPSKIEGIPIILLEALAMGLPVIASDVGGIPTVIEDGFNGFLCDPDDIDGFADKVATLHNDRPRRDEMAQNARRYALEHIDDGEMHRQYLEVLDSLKRSGA